MSSRKTSCVLEPFNRYGGAAESCFAVAELTVLVVAPAADGASFVKGARMLYPADDLDGIRDAENGLRCEGVGDVVVADGSELVVTPTQHRPIAAQRARVIPAGGHVDDLRKAEVFRDRNVLFVPDSTLGLRICAPTHDRAGRELCAAMIESDRNMFGVRDAHGLNGLVGGAACRDLIRSQDRAAHEEPPAVHRPVRHHGAGMIAASVEIQRSEGVPHRMVHEVAPTLDETGAGDATLEVVTRGEIGSVVETTWNALAVTVASPTADPSPRNPAAGPPRFLDHGSIFDRRECAWGELGVLHPVADETVRVVTPTHGGAVVLQSAGAQSGEEVHDVTGSCARFDRPGFRESASLDEAGHRSVSGGVFEIAHSEDVGLAPALQRAAF